MEYTEEFQKIIESDDADDGWVDTHHYDPANTGLEEKVSEMTLDNSKGASMEEAALSNTTNDEGDNKEEDDEEAAEDMEAFEESGLLESDQVNLIIFIYYIIALIIIGYCY